MNEEEKVKKLLTKNMILNLITFAFIFYILGIVIYSQFSYSLYLSADTILEKLIVQENEKVSRKLPNGITEIRVEVEDQNPRLIFIRRNENGRILNDNNNLNSIFEDVWFNNNDLNTIYEINIDGYYFRGVNYKLDNGYYNQVLVNVDSEKAIEQKFITNLTISLVISTIAIMIASFFLSRKTLKPIIISWKKQNQFVQDASHELRTPLAIIKAKQENLLEKPEDKIIDNIEDIGCTLQEVDRLTKLIKELMELARNDSNEQKLNKENFILDKEIKSIIELYKEVAETEEKEFLLNLEYNDEINADLNKLKELLVILLDNSLKYTEEHDSIEVKTYKKDNKCVIEVTDTGIGISKDAIDHVFERFYREEKSRTRSKGGMGLGLSIAYNIVELHKGTIKFDKTREKGTRVIVKLPIK